MRTTILIISIILLFSCNGREHKPVITAKSDETFFNEPLPKCMCRFWYRKFEKQLEAQEFRDSCYKYNIGDTIIGRNRTY